MAVPYGTRFKVDFPQGAYIVGEVAPVTEYQPQEDKVRSSSAKSAAA